MLQIKKIKEQLFPRLLGFPEDVSQRFADEMNDGLLLYDPEHTNADGVRMPRYHCLQCRAYGEMSRDSQICCPKCGNERFRPLKKDRHDSNSRRQYRLIQSMGEYVLVRDFVLYVQENVEKGIVTNNEENFRLVLKNGEMPVHLPAMLMLTNGGV
jgi:DNA-directed RNA polymerase subunit RPC12/RpoP